MQTHWFLIGVVVWVAYSTAVDSMDEPNKTDPRWYWFAYRFAHGFAANLFTAFGKIGRTPWPGEVEGEADKTPSESPRRALAAFGNALIRTFQTLCCVFVAAAIALVCALTWATLTARRATKQAEKDEVQLAQQMSKTLSAVGSIAKSTSDIGEATYATEGEFADMADTLNGIAEGLSDHEAAQLAAAQDVSTKVVTLLDHADTDVLTLGDTERATTDAITSAKTVLDDTALQISNPQIAQSISDIRDSAANTKTSTEQASAILVDGRKVADHYTAQVLKPVSKAKAALNVASEAIGHFVHDVLF